MVKMPSGHYPVEVCWVLQTQKTLEILHKLTPWGAKCGWSKGHLGTLIPCLASCLLIVFSSIIFQNIRQACKKPQGVFHFLNPIYTMNLFLQYEC